jgi:DNA-binding GntR family transcriptional regulator
LREALKVLAAEGLVTLKPRRGCFVTEISEQDLDEIFPLMAMLEGRCALEATQARAARADRQNSKPSIDNSNASPPAIRSSASSRRIRSFTLRIQEMSGNRWLRQVIQDLRKVLKLTRLFSLSIEGRLQQSLAEHTAILEAIRAGDATRAQT